MLAIPLLAQGLLVEHPWLAAGYVTVTALDAIVFLRVFGRVFLGPGEAHEARCPDLEGRERLAAFVLAALALAAGLAPYPLVAARDSVAGEIAREIRSSTGGATRDSPRRRDARSHGWDDAGP
jgi:NADH:ubiquinone oxidoreductase subunit 4 (subunit M)